MWPLRTQRGCQVVNVPSADAVDDACFLAVTVEDLEDLPIQVHPRQDAIGQVGAVEVANEDLGILEAKLVDDVPLHPLGGRGRVGMDRCLGEEFFEKLELAIFRAKIMAPVADAVGLVDGEGADAGLLQKALEALQSEPFGRDEQKPDGPLN